MAASFTQKLESLETLVDTLLTERNGLREDLARLRQDDSGGDEGNEDLMAALEELRAKLSDSEALGQKLIRERGQARERLIQIRNRLVQVEAKLLEQR